MLSGVTGPQVAGFLSSLTRRQLVAWLGLFSRD